MKKNVIALLLATVMMASSIGTVPAIDIEAYAKALQSFEDSDD